MKVLIADKFEASGVEGIKALGCEVIYDPDLKEDSLRDALAQTGAEALIVRSTKVTEPMLEAGQLSLVVRAGAGYNTIDVAAASRRGIYVTNCPGMNAIAVAELTMGLILSLDRRIPENVIQLREGRWNKKEFSKAKGLYGQTLALIGLGNIGQEVATRAKAFGLLVVAWSRSLTPAKAEKLGVQYAASPQEAAAKADIVSVHLALSPDTRGLCDQAFFEAMNPGAFFINTSRAEVVDQAAMEEAIQMKKLRVGLDVFEGEPSGGEGEYDGSLRTNASVYATHHIGASTDQAQEAIAAETVRILREYLETGAVPNVVNLCRHTPATHLLIARHYDRVGVLAHIFDQLRAAGINAQETNNIVFEGAEAAIAKIQLDKAPDEPTLAKIRENENILAVDVVTLDSVPAKKS